MTEVTLSGHQRNDFTPVLIKSVLSDSNDRDSFVTDASRSTDTGGGANVTSNKLLDIRVDVNPMDALVDVRVRAVARPLQIVFDSQTLTEMLRILKLSDDSFLPL